MIKVIINGEPYDLIFLIVPKLTVIIIGCESLTSQNAKIDFENSKGNIVNIPFLREDDEQNTDINYVQNDISQDTFFVEYMRICSDIDVAEVHVKQIDCHCEEPLY